MPNSRQVAKNLVLDAARDQRILDLQIADRMDLGGAADGVGANLGQADVTDEPGLDHFGDGADRVLDRHVGIDARRPVDVDMVGAQPLQRIGERGLERLGPGVVAQPVAERIAQRAELDRQQEPVAVLTLQRLADQHFIVAHAVEVAGVEQRHPGLDGGVNGGDAFGPVGGAVHVRHAHASEAED